MPGILKVLKGPLSTCGKKNRNQRVYSKQLWENVLKSEYWNDMIKNNTLCGEIVHPGDRTESDSFEIDARNISHRVTEAHLEGDKLMGTIEVLDTEQGRNLNALINAGCTVGISARGMGDLIGDEVDPDTYNFKCFDITMRPSDPNARLVPLAESEKTKLIIKESEETDNLITESVSDLPNVKCVVVYYDKDNEHRAGSDWTHYSHYTPQNTLKFIKNKEFARPAEAKSFLILSPIEFDNAYKKDNVKNVNTEEFINKATLLEADEPFDVDELYNSSYQGIKFTELPEDIQIAIEENPDSVYTVYQCDNCDNIFTPEEADEVNTTYEEYYGVADDFPDSHPFTYSVCPNCKDDGISEIKLTQQDFIDED